ncbi:hypothetical protein Pat9b_4099 (plasmid) [Pantoea sp. At-9b]|nr:hypothetical protein Pat9b_4099 [Pantoea sp. At-9b]
MGIGETFHTGTGFAGSRRPLPSVPHTAPAGASMRDAHSRTDIIHFCRYGGGYKLYLKKESQNGNGIQGTG